jgi:tripartite-type tricarboxylate transporter receptor subunit TctC
MTPTRRGLVAGAALLPFAAQAQATWPDRPLRMIVSFPGGSMFPDT